jgi:hypothetical protein
VGIVAEALARLRQADQLEHLERAVARLPLEAPRCRRTGSATCSPIVIVGFSEDCESWKIIATSLPRIAAGRARGSPTSSRPLELDRAFDDVAAVRQQAEDRQAESSTCRSPTRRPGRASRRLDLEVDVADRLHDRARQLDVRREVVDLERARIVAGASAARSRTSKASRSASPTRLHAMTTRTRQPPTG